MNMQAASWIAGFLKIQQGLRAIFFFPIIQPDTNKLIYFCQIYRESTVLVDLLLSSKVLALPDITLLIYD